MAKGAIGKGGRTQIPGASKSARGKATAGATSGVPGSPKKVTVSRATNVKKGFRIPGSKAKGK